MVGTFYGSDPCNQQSPSSSAVYSMNQPIPSSNVFKLQENIKDLQKIRVQCEDVPFYDFIPLKFTKTLKR